jgi:hypothetical protein
MAAAAPVADSSAALKTPPSTPVADRVKAQLARDYPPGALSWVSGLSWQGPQQVPVMQIDRSTGDTKWSDAAADKRKVELFRKRITGGFRKPVVLIRMPGRRLLFAMDGHTRILACTALGVPVTAWIGTAKTDAGPWLKAHDRQLAIDAPAVELAGMTAVQWNEQLHPRLRGKFAFKGGQPATTARTRHAVMGAAAPQPPEPPEPPADLTQIQALHRQAAADRRLARQILVKANALARIRDSYIAGLTSVSGVPKGPVNPKKSAAAKKAAATRKRKGTAGKKSGKPRAKAGTAKAANVAKLNGQISLLRRDA